MFDIITFGSAAWDVFLKLKNSQAVKSKNFITGKGVCFNLGSKIDAEEIHFSSGGGGTNTAATFVNQGFKTAYWGTVGNDIFGQKIMEELKKLAVETDFVKKTNKKPTNFSVILSSAERDRTVLAYRGASEHLETRFPNAFGNRVSKIANWFYLAPLSGQAAGLTKKIVDFAKRNKIKIALNPGNSQLCLKNIKDVIKKVDVLILNQEEASILTGIEYNKEKEIFSRIDEICPGIVIMTKGPEGGVVSDGNYLYKVEAPEVKVTDRTGGGDAAGSGFVSGFLQSKGDIEYAIQLAMANAVSCLQKWGAKDGLMKRGQKFKKIEVKKEKCQGYNCKIK